MREVSDMRITKSMAFLLALVTVILAVIGSLLFRAGSTTPQGVRSVIYFVCASLVMLLCALLLYFLWLSRDKESNYFLYDRELGRNVPLESLTFRMVNEKMTAYVAAGFESSAKLWLGNAWLRGDGFGVNGEYRGLVAYKMLYDLIETDREDSWRLFADAPEATVARVCEALSGCGEKTLAHKLMYLKQSCGGEVAPLKSLLSGSRRYLEGKMTGLVRRNIEWFYYT